MKRMLLLGIAAIAALVVTASVASGATGTSYVYTQPGHAHASASCYSACGGVGRFIYPANGTAIHMYCWADEGWYTGNYASNRWFVVSINGQPGQWFIHSSYVYYQVSIPHC